MPERLVRETYFVSPTYEDSFTDHKVEETSVTTRISARRVLDDMDDFGDWLRDNTHYDSRYVSSHGIRPFGRLMGENGVFCEITYTTHHIYGESQSTPVGPYGSYNVFVSVLSSPSSKDLPSELLKVLEERKYERADSEKIIPTGYEREVPLAKFFK